jgi:hypothetical protein
MANQQQQQQKPQPSNLVKDGKVVAAIAGPTFGVLEFTTPDSATVYDNRTGKSTTAVIAKVPLAGIGLAFTANVYADLTKEGTVSFRSSLPKGLTATEAIRDEFKRHIKAGLSAWPGYKRAAKSAYDRLTAVKGASSPDSPLEYRPEPETEPADGEPAAAGA